MDKDSLIAFLSIHKIENPVYSKEIEAKFEIKGEQLRHEIMELRREGFPIASTRDGYYWARTLAELDSTLEHLKGRRNSLDLTIQCMQKRFRNSEEQTLFD
jgi:biotin operon repressor